MQPIFLFVFDFFRKKEVRCDLIEVRWDLIVEKMNKELFCFLLFVFFFLSDFFFVRGTTCHVIMSEFLEGEIFPYFKSSTAKNEEKEGNMAKCTTLFHEDLQFSFLLRSKNK